MERKGSEISAEFPVLLNTAPFGVRGRWINVNGGIGADRVVFMRQYGFADAGFINIQVETVWQMGRRTDPKAHTQTLTGKASP